MRKRHGEDGQNVILFTSGCSNVFGCLVCPLYALLRLSLYMKPVRRRLVYVTHDEEAMLSELTGTTPPAWQSRLSTLIVTPSSCSQPASNQTGEDSASRCTVDGRLLVSYDGFLLTDGRGTMATPRCAEDAARMCTALKKCCAFLRRFTNESPSWDLSEDTSLSTTSDADDDSTPNSVSSPARTRRARPARVATTREKVTVAQLREQLRGYGLPVTGTKQTLLRRLQMHHAHDHAAVSTPPQEEPTEVKECEEGKDALADGDAHGAEAKRTCGTENPFVEEPRVSHGSSLATGRLSSYRSSLPRRDSSGTSDCLSPISRASTGSGGLWGALVDVGARLFRPKRERSSGYLIGPDVSTLLWKRHRDH